MNKTKLSYQLTSLDGKIEGEIFATRSEAIECKNDFTLNACKLLVIKNTESGNNPVVKEHILLQSKYGKIPFKK